MKPRKFLSVIIGAIIMVFMSFFNSSCSKSGNSNNNTTPPGGIGNGTTISVSGMAFPASTTVTKGTIVTWNNKDSYAHTVTSDDGKTFNGNLAAYGASGSTFSYAADSAGTFTYHCNIHSNMHGTLIVNP